MTADKPYIYADMKIVSIEPFVIEMHCVKKGRDYYGRVYRESFQPAVFIAMRMSSLPNGRIKNTKTFEDKLFLADDKVVMFEAMRWSLISYDSIKTLATNARNKEQLRMRKIIFT